MTQFNRVAAPHWVISVARNRALRPSSVRRRSTSPRPSRDREFQQGASPHDSSPQVPSLPADVAALEARSDPDPRTTRIVEFAPHDLEDVFALCRSLGGPLVGDEEALQLERRIGRPLALVGGQSPPEGRPGVVAIVDSSPLVIAGGHSFETDLIEIAGGTSLTHGSDDVRRPIDREALARLAPDLILVMTTPEPEPALQERIALELGELAPVVFFPFPNEGFWLTEPERIAARLHDLIAEFRPQRPIAADSSAEFER